MNMNSLRKHYPRLEPRERIAAILAAAARGDDEELRALVDTAPRVGYSVSHHWLTFSAIETIALMTVVTCLANGGALLMGIFLAREDKEVSIDNLCDIAASLLTQEMAFNRFCWENGIDPGAALVNIPGTGVTSPDGPGGADLLGYYRELAAVLCPDGARAEDVEALLQVYRDTMRNISGG